MRSESVHWKTWSPEAFDLSRETGRPLLVFLTAFYREEACEAIRAELEEGAQGTLLSKSFVAVAADADRHPEIALRYSLSAVPSVLILAPDGSPLAVFDNLDPKRMRSALSGLATCAAQCGLGAARGLGSCSVPYLPTSEGGLERGLEALESIRSRVEDALPRLDSREFTAQQRIEALRFLIRLSACTGEKGMLARVTEALHETAHSALYDPVEGGFFGGTSPSGPMTYKLLRQNADWLILALRVGVEPEAAFARSLAKGIFHYLQTHLQRPGGGFRNAQREDPGYYALSREGRRRFTPPPHDDTVYAAPNALAVRALCKGWRLLGEKTYLEQALSAFEFLSSAVEGLDGKVAHAFDGSPSGAGYLDDVVEMGQAYLALYLSTLDPLFLEGVRRMAAQVASDFKNPAGEGFLDKHLPSGASRLPERPTVDPALAARASAFLLLAAVQLEDDALAAPARGALGALLGSPSDDLEALSLTGSALLAALFPMALFEAITDGSGEQRFRILERLRQLGPSYAAILQRGPVPREGMQRLPRLVGHCGSQRFEVVVEDSLHEGIAISPVCLGPPTCDI